MWESTAAVRKKLLSGVTQRIISSMAAGIAVGVGGQRLPLVGVIAERPQASGDQGAGGLGATRDEQARLVHDRFGVEVLAVDGRRWPTPSSGRCRRAPGNRAARRSWPADSGLNSRIASIIPTIASWS